MPRLSSRTPRRGATTPECHSARRDGSVHRAEVPSETPARAERLRSAAPALHPTYAWMETEGDEAPYPGCLTPLGVAALASLRTPTSVRSALNAVGGDGRRLLRFLQRTPGWRRRETVNPGCLTSLGCACASSNVRLDGGGGRRGALPGLSDSARAIALAARADLGKICLERGRRRRSALARSLRARAFGPRLRSPGEGYIGGSDHGEEPLP